MVFTHRRLCIAQDDRETSTGWRQHEARRNERPKEQQPDEEQRCPSGFVNVTHSFHRCADLKTISANLSRRWRHFAILRHSAHTRIDRSSSTPCAPAPAAHPSGYRRRPIMIAAANRARHAPLPIADTNTVISNTVAVARLCGTTRCLMPITITSEAATPRTMKPTALASSTPGERSGAIEPLPIKCEIEIHPESARTLSKMRRLMMIPTAPTFGKPFQYKRQINVTATATAKIARGKVQRVVLESISPMIVQSDSTQTPA